MRSPSLEKFAIKFADVVGTSWAFLLAIFLCLAWVVALVVDPREVVENPRLVLVEVTGLFIFIHLFLIQRTHNKDVKALHLKLDELIASKDGASNKLIKSEHAPEEVLDELHQAYENLADSQEHPTAPIAVDSEIEVRRRRKSQK